MLVPCGPVTDDKPQQLPKVNAKPTMTITRRLLLKLTPLIFWRSSTLPASPDALAGALALSRIVSCKLSDILETLFEWKRNSIASSSTNDAICPNDVPRIFVSAPESRLSL